jgi:transcriptional regulator with XRE-family HTH domain
MATHPVDMHVGMRLRQRRLVLGLSQTKLGAAVALSFQRVQKYERGTSRMVSSQLFEFARVLDVPVSYFFDNMPGSVAAFEHGKDTLAKRETLGLVRAYHRIRADRVRNKLFEMVKALGAVDDKDLPAARKKR